MQEGTTGPIHFINLEYFFRLLYQSRGDVVGSTTPFSFADGFWMWVMHVWTVLGFVSFVFSLVAFFILAYSTIRMHQLREAEEHERWSTLSPEEAETAKDHSRWAHIQELIESGQPRDWREAVMEADIMLDDMLVERGYKGETTMDKLNTVPASTMSLEDAKEAHRVRNRIAHDGSAFVLDEHLAYRTIKQFERVFKEFGEI